MIRYNSLEVSEKPFSHETETDCESTAFFLHHNRIYSSGRIFVLYKWQGPLFIWLNIFSRPFYLLENVVIFSTKPTGFFYVRAHIEQWRLQCWHLWASYILCKWPRALSYIHDSSSLACRNSYCVPHNVSNALLLLTAFGGESCLKLCYSFEWSTRYEIPQFLVHIIRFERILKSRSENSEKLGKDLLNYDLSSGSLKKHFYRLENPSKLPFFFPPHFQTIVDKSLGTLLHFWGVFQSCT